MTTEIAVMRDLVRVARERESAVVRLLGRFVRCESPSYDKAAVDRFGAMVASEWRRRGAKVKVLEQRLRGDHLRIEVAVGTARVADGQGDRSNVAKIDGRGLRGGARRAAGQDDGQILVLGHLDTVYPLGTIAKMPFRVAGGKAWGPGTFDMKGGLVLALAAVDVLREASVSRRAGALRAAGPRKRIVFLWTSDEEIGSETSRRAIESEARRSNAVLVLEPSLGREGRLKTQRKGVGGAEVIVKGRSAHAGIEPEKGVNAVHELALQIARLMKMNDPGRGITVQATVADGGTTSNVVPAHAHALVDIRFARLADARGIERELRSLRPILRGARVEVRVGDLRPPLERSEGVHGLFRVARGLMHEVGHSLGEASTGGGSDGSFTAALGVPTLDGLGAVGDGAHSPREHVVVRELAVRAALIAGLLVSL
ncbi:MAG: M20 family metallopeptidase [Candidatus Acidiferrales bacterium]